MSHRQASRGHDDRDVFSKRVSRQKKERAIDRVEAAADEQWLRAAHAALVHVARNRRIFSADYVWMELRVRDAGFPHEPRAMGAVFREAFREKICEPLTQYDTCSRPRRQGGLVRCWKSLLIDLSEGAVKMKLSGLYGKFPRPVKVKKNSASGEFGDMKSKKKVRFGKLSTHDPKPAKKPAKPAKRSAKKSARKAKAS